ncbi:MAG: potassium-transporting ATPase subunit KdpA [Acidimicrobiales bacterium]
MTWLAWAERPLYRALGVDPEAEQSWKSYAGGVVIFSAAAIVVTYAILRLQGHLPLNPGHMGGVTPNLAWNTAVSFVTNTNRVTPSTWLIPGSWPSSWRAVAIPT